MEKEEIKNKNQNNTEEIIKDIIHVQELFPNPAP